METVKSIGELRKFRAGTAEPVGLVPTMGFLHSGHMALVQRARQECASVLVSIFVNPSQFGPQEDYTSYPRNLAHDLEMLEGEKTDLVWIPGLEEMYPAGYQTWVAVEEVSLPLEGAKRPGHFRGVTTVVAKLFNAVQPHKAYFGQKDAQQVAVIKRMVQDLNFPLEICVCPTVREVDGLAMSSRNSYLNSAERQAAVVLYRSLKAALQAYHQGERNAYQLRQVMLDFLAAEPLAEPQYVSCAHPATLQELEEVTAGALLSMAVIIGKTRLIDNLILS